MKFFKNNKGTSLVEFVLILPVLIVILFGIIEFALVLYNKAMITNASREGARAGVVFNANTAGDYSPLTESDIITTVNNYLANHLITFSNATANTQVVGSDAGGSPHCPPLNQTTPPRQITVTVNYPYTFLLLPNFVPGLVGLNPLNLTAVSTMRCE